MRLLASEFTGPLYVVMGVGAAVAGVGLLMVIAIFMGWAKPPTRSRAAEGGGGAWEVVKKVLDKIFQWVPKAYRFPVALIMLGSLIMIIPLAIGFTASSGGGTPSPTNSGTTTGG